jgi:hypothetical protein
MQMEIEAALAQLVGIEPRFGHVRLLGWGAMQAWGRRGGLQVHHEEEGDVTASVRHKWRGGPAVFDAWRQQAELMLARSVLRGPSDEEAPDLRERGWDPTAARRIAEDRARSEREQVVRFDANSYLRRGRLRDAISTRYLGFELMDGLTAALDAHGLALTLPQLLDDIDTARSFTDSMPSGDAWISLLTTAHRNPESRWEANDIFDFDAMTVAIPYCDVVVTDKHVCELAHRAGLPGRLGTTVIATLDELIPLLCDLR